MDMPFWICKRFSNMCLPHRHYLCHRNSFHNNNSKKKVRIDRHFVSKLIVPFRSNEMPQSWTELFYVMVVSNLTFSVLTPSKKNYFRLFYIPWFLSIHQHIASHLNEKNRPELNSKFLLICDWKGPIYEALKLLLNGFRAKYVVSVYSLDSLLPNV